MKRADLYRNRRTRTGGAMISSRTNRTHITTSGEAKILPMYHWLQLSLCTFLLLLLISSQIFINSEKSQELYNALNQHITYSMNFQDREWSGTLKEILFTEE